jgi:type IV secretion system protein VirD4
METANLISQLLGNKTAEQVSYNKPKYLDLNPGARSLHVSGTQRALLLPQEVIQLDRADEIILIESQPPIRAKKIIYFKEKLFTSRLIQKVKIPQQAPYMPDHTGKKDAKGADKAKDATPPAADAAGGAADGAAGTDTAGAAGAAGTAGAPPPADNPPPSGGGSNGGSNPTGGGSGGAVLGVIEGKVE